MFVDYFHYNPFVPEVINYGYLVNPFVPEVTKYGYLATQEFPFRRERVTQEFPFRHESDNLIKI